MVKVTTARQADACAARRRAVARKTAAEKADALLVSRPQDVGYLSGFSGDDSCLLIGRGWHVLITDGRYDEQARAECDDIEVHVRKGSMATTVAELVRARKIRRLAIQSDHATVQFHQAIAKAVAPRKVKAAGGLVASLRLVKDAAEVRAVRRAIAVAQRAFRQMLAAGARRWAGRTERELAAELDYRMRLAGAEGPAFETIVAAGPHGSLPHYRPGSTRARSGQAVLVDWGAKVSGYCCDLTRVVFLGRIPRQLARVHEVVRRAQEAGIRAIRAGATCHGVDAAARDVIAQAGYAKQFVHGLGHGLGREVHEAPGLARNVRTRLRAGMIVTVEPGVYLPGAGGVRIEDDVLVMAGGRRRLTSLPRRAEAMLL